MRTFHNRVCVEAADREMANYSHAERDEDSEGIKCAVEALTRILQFIAPRNQRRMRPATLSTRIVAIYQVVNPELLGKSLRQIEKETGGEISHAQVCQIAKEFEEEFGLRSSRRLNANHSEEF